MRRNGRARNYTTLRHTGEQVLALVYGNGWPAELMYRVGLHRTFNVEQHQLVVPNHTGTGDAPDRPLRIAFASDFHAGPITPARVIATACQALTQAQPDVLLLGGDFVSLDARHIDTLIEHLAPIPAPYGRFAVLGNHDLWADEQYIIRQLEAIGIRVLMNRNVQLAPPFAHVWICGLDDICEGTPDVTSAFAGAEGVRIVLMHAPQGLEDLPEQPFTLALCGHTHGGQIVLPNGKPVFIPPGKLNQKFLHGRFHVGPQQQSLLLVSRGIGCSTLPVRLFADPDILLCEMAFI